MLGNTKLKESGFTIVELSVSVAAGAVVVLAVLSISLFFFADVMRAEAQTKLMSESQIALNRVVEDVRTGSAILLNNTVTDINEPTGGWTTSNTDLIIIISTPALDSSNNFIIDDDTGNPYQNEYIYFTDNESHLHKRVLADSAAAGNIATTTCPETATTPSCPADSILTENFSTMSFVFFDRDNNETADPTVARSANINIYMSKTVYGRSLTAENIIRMSLRNPQD